MKNLLLLFIMVVFGGTIEAQTKLPKERITVIANIANGQAKSASYALSDLRIEPKIKRAFRLNSTNLTLVNPTITDEGGKGWFIQYEFESNGSIGLWKEQLSLINGQLVITESRSAVIALATNCNEIQFTDVKERCQCVSKKSATSDSQVTYRLFSSIQ